MIFEFSTDLLVQMMRTDNYIRVIVLDGIPRDHMVEHVKINTDGNLEVLTRDGDGVASIERKAVTIHDLTGTTGDTRS